MQHIKTKFGHGEKGARVYARSTSGLYCWVAYDHSLTDDENHHAAARKLRAKLGWPPGMFYLFCGRRRGGYIYVRRDEDVVDL